MPTVMPRLDARARRELIALAIVGMEVSWLSFVAHGIMLVTQSRTIPAPPLPYLGLMLGAYLFYRLVDRLSLQVRYERAVMAAFLVLGMLIMLWLAVYPQYALFDLHWVGTALADLMRFGPVMASEITVPLLTLLLFARGIALARADLSSAAVGLRFRWGILVLALVVPLAQQRWAAPPLVFLFFFCGLCAIAMARTAEAGSESGATGRFGAGWLGAIVGAAAVVLALAMGMASVLTGENIVRFLEFLAPLVAVVGFIVMGFVWVFAQILFLLEPILRPLVRGLIDAWRAMAELLSKLYQITPQDPTPPIELSPTVINVLGNAKGILTILVFVLVVLAILWAMHSLMGRREEAEEERETVFSPGIITSALRRLLKTGQERLGAWLGQARQFGLGGLFAAITIRRIYAQMAALAARRGYPRGRAQTPLEYAPALGQAYPGGGDAIGRITRAYLGVRYGELPETREDFDAVRDAWEQLKTIEPPAGRSGDQGAAPRER